jgi:hypothetical protein
MIGHGVCVEEMNLSTTFDGDDVAARSFLVQAFRQFMRRTSPQFPEKNAPADVHEIIHVPSAPQMHIDRSGISGITTPNPASDLPRWLSVEQVRKMQRMRRETVLKALRAGELPFEQRGRIRYVRLSDVLAWEERRLQSRAKQVVGLVHPYLAHFA